eukprot:15013029-Alexandrium_andersonii.AAC.1
MQKTRRYNISTRICGAASARMGEGVFCTRAHLSHAASVRVTTSQRAHSPTDPLWPKRVGWPGLALDLCVAERACAAVLNESKLDICTT